MSGIFTWNPDYGASVQRQPRTKNIRFGDGYEQRIPDGINALPETWELTFANRDQTEINAIDDFLKARGGVEWFEWTAPRSAVVNRYVCKQWQRQIAIGALDTITATFEQVFDAGS